MLDKTLFLSLSLAPSRSSSRSLMWDKALWSGRLPGSQRADENKIKDVSRPSVSLSFCLLLRSLIHPLIHLSLKRSTPPYVPALPSSCVLIGRSDRCLPNPRDPPPLINLKVLSVPHTTPMRELYQTHPINQLSNQELSFVREEVRERPVRPMTSKERRCPVIARDARDDSGCGILASREASKEHNGM